MTPHRISLTDRELEIITSALAARMAGVSPARAEEIYRLFERLRECSPGNPDWRLGRKPVAQRD